ATRCGRRPSRSSRWGSSMARSVIWTANHEDGTLNEWAVNGGSGSSTSSGSIATSTEQAHGGTRSAKATVNSGSGNKFARTQLNLEYGEGDYVSFGAWFYIPSAFLSAM